MPTHHYRKDGGKHPHMALYTGYLPENLAIYRKFHDDLAQNQATSGPHKPAVEAFKQAITSEKLLYDLFQQIFLERDPKYVYENQAKDFEDLLHKLDVIVAGPPKFYIAKDDDGKEIGEPIGVPIYLLFDSLINTLAAFDLFRNQSFNVAMKGLLDSWGRYLTTDDSRKTLNTTAEGWFSQASVQKLEEKGRGSFVNTYQLRNSDIEKGYGYYSWDDFFTRNLKNEHIRPINKPGDDPSILIHHACESTPVRIAHNVQLHDRFWLKSQPYSLYDMLNRDEKRAKQFVGGTVYQSFLSPQDYHRWHAPVDGVIEKAEVVYGTYYSALPDEGAPKDDLVLHEGVPFGAFLRSQPWLTFVCTRALIYIKAKSPKIGTVCFIGVGMVEVSTCDITVNEGQEVKTGDELGMFHFGGSGHCLIFQPEAKVVLDFPEVQPQEVGEDKNPIYGKHVWVNALIGHSEA
ncbi:phosphatidylserine decarboxylase [Marasmius fiardii PR-910]|nr:phosphatidylserine decarboxylase [Marasmius fiardii PR-910]